MQFRLSVTSAYRVSLVSSVFLIELAYTQSDSISRPTVSRLKWPTYRDGRLIENHVIEDIHLFIIN